eukprot:1699779-Amphidinium_carterae.1
MAVKPKQNRANYETPLSMYPFLGLVKGAAFCQDEMESFLCPGWSLEVCGWISIHFKKIRTTSIGMLRHAHGRRTSPPTQVHSIRNERRVAEIPRSRPRMIAYVECRPIT